jgi:hypothetical protein
VGVLPAGAARPLLDKGQWDAYFALFARDVNVPWKPSSVRLDTYSGAAVDFAAYAVDPAEVIVAGQNRPPRAIDTSHVKAVVKWRFSPPSGLHFTANDVDVPLGNQEGFYVIEARRGDAVQQVWLNRTHIGLVTKESPEGLLLWGVDLRSGRALSGMHVDFLVGLHFVERKTDGNGLIVWTDRSRPSFALAESGAGRAFVSFLPQAPVPPAIVALRLESAVARSGGAVRFAGFARRRTGGVFRRAGGEAHVALLGRGHTLATVQAKLDASGAFDGTLDVPAGTEAGEYAILATVGGAVGGTSLHVDAAADTALAIVNPCPCDPAASIPVSVLAVRAAQPAPNVDVRVQIVRSPHVLPAGASEEAGRWASTIVYRGSVRTDAAGRAEIKLPPPTDGLDSTYGVRATTAGASATGRIVVNNARIALQVEPERASVDVGQPASFALRGFDAGDDAPAAGLSVRVRLSHGTTVSEQTAVLDAAGRARVVFAQPSLGSNLVLVSANVDGKQALDANSVVVEPNALSGQVAAPDADVVVTVDKPRYKSGDRVEVRAVAPGAGGDALLTLEGARTFQARVARTNAGTATATLDLGDAQGDVRVGAAFVRNSALALAGTALLLDGAGHPRATELSLDRASYAAGDTAHVTVRDGGAHGDATYVIRVADGRESGAALFEDAPAVLAAGGTSSQYPAAENPEWHAYVAPVRSKASDIFAAERARKVPTEPPALGAAAPRTMYWRVERSDAEALDVPVPKQRGRYVLSVMKISESGEVGAASVAFLVL